LNNADSNLPAGIYRTREHAFVGLLFMILFMLVSENTTDWPVFSSPYNWFHR